MPAPAWPDAGRQPFAFGRHPGAAAVIRPVVHDRDAFGIQFSVLPAETSLPRSGALSWPSHSEGGGGMHIGKSGWKLREVLPAELWSHYFGDVHCPAVSVS